jgi:DNA primase
MPRVTDDQIALIKANCDLGELFSEVTTLKRSGRSQVCLCPFHIERTPSCHVYPENRFHCFGCGAQGDPIDFVKLRYKIDDFQDAVAWLARRFALDITLETGDRTRLVAMKHLLSVVDFVATRAQQLLFEPVGATALHWLTEVRRLPVDLLREFQVGYLPSGSAVYDELIGNGVSDDDLLQAGLAYRASDGQILLHFSDRIVFPLVNRKRQICGFSGRMMPGSASEKKYYNTPDSLVFRKAECLFGLRELKARTTRTRCVAIVEGPLDVLAFASADMPGVSPCGTAMSRTQAQLLTAAGKLRPVIALDRDLGGESAVPKNILTLLASDHLPCVASLPPGKDPGDLVDDPLALQAALEQPRDWLPALQESYDATFPGEDEIARADRFITAIRPIPDPDRRSFAAERVDLLLKLAKGTILERMARQQAALIADPTTPAPRPMPVDRGADGWVLVRLALHHPALRAQVPASPTLTVQVNQVLDLLRPLTATGDQLRRELGDALRTLSPEALSLVMESLSHDDFVDLTPTEAESQFAFTLSCLAASPRRRFGAVAP